MAVPIPSITGGASSLTSGLAQGNISVVTGGGKKNQWVTPVSITVAVTVIVTAAIFFAKK